MSSRGAVTDADGAGELTQGQPVDTGDPQRRFGLRQQRGPQIAVVIATVGHGATIARMLSLTALLSLTTFWPCRPTVSAPSEVSAGSAPRCAASSSTSRATSSPGCAATAITPFRRAT